MSLIFRGGGPATGLPQNQPQRPKPPAMAGGGGSVAGFQPVVPGQAPRPFADTPRGAPQPHTPRPMSPPPPFISDPPGAPQGGQNPNNPPMSPPPQGPLEGPWMMPGGAARMTPDPSMETGAMAQPPSVPSSPMSPQETMPQMPQAAPPSMPSPRQAPPPMKMPAPNQQGTMTPRYPKNNNFHVQQREQQIQDARQQHGRDWRPEMQREANAVNNAGQYTQPNSFENRSAWEGLAGIPQQMENVKAAQEAARPPEIFNQLQTRDFWNQRGENEVEKYQREVQEDIAPDGSYVRKDRQPAPTYKDGTPIPQIPRPGEGRPDESRTTADLFAKPPEANGLLDAAATAPSSPSPRFGTTRSQQLAAESRLRSQQKSPDPSLPFGSNSVYTQPGVKYQSGSRDQDYNVNVESGRQSSPLGPNSPGHAQASSMPILLAPGDQGPAAGFNASGGPVNQGPSQQGDPRSQQAAPRQFPQAAMLGTGAQNMLDGQGQGAWNPITGEGYNSGAGGPSPGFSPSGPQGAAQGSPTGFGPVGQPQGPLGTPRPGQPQGPQQPQGPRGPQNPGLPSGPSPIPFPDTPPVELPPVDDSAGRLPAAFQDAFNSANKANIDRYNQGLDILEGRYMGSLDWQGRSANNMIGQYDDRFNRNMDRLEGLGDQELADIGQRYDQQRAGAAQGLVNRGLGNTTVRNAVNRGIGESESQDLGRAQERIRQQQLNTDIALSGDYLNSQQGFHRERLGLMNEMPMDIVNWIGDRTDAFPDFGQLMELAFANGNRGVGGLGGAPIHQTPQQAGYNIPQGPGIGFPDGQPFDGGANHDNRPEGPIWDEFGRRRDNQGGNNQGGGGFQGIPPEWLGAGGQNPFPGGIPPYQPNPNDGVGTMPPSPGQNPDAPPVDQAGEAGNLDKRIDPGADPSAEPSLLDENLFVDPVTKNPLYRIDPKTGEKIDVNDPRFNEDSSKAAIPQGAELRDGNSVWKDGRLIGYIDENGEFRPDTIYERADNPSRTP